MLLADSLVLLTLTVTTEAVHFPAPSHANPGPGPVKRGWVLHARVLHTTESGQASVVTLAA